MMKVNRMSVPVPASLRETDPRREAAIELARKHFARPRHERRQHRFFFDSRIDQSREVALALDRLFHGKCAYCECRLDANVDLQRNINRLRPRTFASNLNGKSDEDAYWWKCYQWSNLYYACAPCTRSKGKRFPVKGKRGVPGVPFGTTTDEHSLVLDPCDEQFEPDIHLAFDAEGNVVGLTPEGKTTITLFGLNRLDLVRQRRDSYKHIKALLREGLSKQTSVGDEWTLALRQEIADPSQPFLTGKRQLASRALIVGDIAQDTGELSLERLILSFTKVIGAGVSSPVIAELMRYIPTLVVNGDDLKTRIASAKKLAAVPPAAADPSKKEFLHVTRHIETVEIVDFGRIKHLKLDFTKSPSQNAPWMMILGENGVGKSSILKAIALTLVGQRYLHSLGLDAATFVRKGAKRSQISIRISNMAVPLTLIIDPKLGFVHSEEEAKVLILAYGSTRLMPRPDTQPHREAEYGKVDNLFNPFVPVGDAEKFLLELPHKAFDDYARALKQMFAVLRGPEELVRKSGSVLVKTTTGLMSLSQLSDGYQSVIGVTTDIMRIFSRYWPAMETAEGIVLIDELGAHLHPRWRMRVVTGLRRAFPRVQFIATTHEPLCLRGLEKAEVVLFRESTNGDSVAIADLPDVKSMRVEQILTSEHFGLFTTLDPDLDDEFVNYLELRREAKGVGGDDVKARLEAARRELDARMVLGQDRRERMMLDTIDQFLADERAMESPEERKAAKEKTQGILTHLFASIPPIPERSDTLNNEGLPTEATDLEA